MIITDVRIKELENAGKLLAVATIVLDNCFAVRDIRILDGRNGLYIAFPSIRVKEHHKDLAHPIDAKTRESMTMEILKRYEALKMTEIYDHYEDNKNYALKRQLKANGVNIKDSKDFKCEVLDDANIPEKN